EVVEGLASADQARLSILNEDFGWEWLAVVVGGHHEAVRAGPLENEVVADCSHGQTALTNEAALFLRKDVARFAERSPDNDVLQWPLDTAGQASRGAGRADRHRVISAVENRPRQVVEAGVEQIEGVGTHLLDGADFADQIAALGDQVAAGLNFQRQLV